MSEFITIRVKVSPGSRTSSLAEAVDGVWLARLKSPPIGGKANAELMTLIASHFGCARSAVSIKSGARNKLKMLRIER